MRDMTEGGIPQHMIRFTIPLLLGNILQQLYNTADTIIVGRIAGKTALAAVGSAGAIMNVLLFLIVGMSLGASVLLATFFGSKNEAMIKKELATVLLGGLLFTAALAAVAAALTTPLLNLINTPEELQPMARSYLRIIIFGLCFTFLYNILSGALRSIGNARVPLVTLGAAAALNVVLDLVLVPRMGAAGAAVATIFSQALAALLCFCYIQLRVPVLRLGLRDLTIDLDLLKQTVQYSGVSAIQQAFVYIGVLLVQGAANTLGIDAIAAFNACSKIDGFALMPGNALASALSTFVAQNRGARRNDRIPEGLKWALAIGLCYCCTLTVTLTLTAERLMLMFLDASETTAIGLGASYLRLIALPYLMTAVCNSFQGFFRGLGRMGVTLKATVVQIPVRVVLAHLLVGRLGLGAIPTAMATGWVCMIAYELFEYRNYRLENRVQLG